MLITLHNDNCVCQSYINAILVLKKIQQFTNLVIKQLTALAPSPQIHPDG